MSKNMTEGASTTETLKMLLERRNEMLRDHDQEISRVTRKLVADGAPEETLELLCLYGGAELITHKLLQLARKEQKLEQVASFRQLMVYRTRKHLVGKGYRCPEWLLNDKTKAYKFADLIKLPRPRQDKTPYSAEMLPERYPAVVKPRYGVASRGVYLLYSENRIFDINRSRFLSGRKQLLKAMQGELEAGVIKQDKWLLEELIGSEDRPAVDLKFLSFYGEVMLVREIMPKPYRLDCWWDREGHRAETGIRINSKEVLEGHGFTPEQLEQIEKVSREIPAPFVRIDCLYAGGDLYFGEFTPRPGHFDDFTQAFDRKLGDAFLRAEGRLNDDLLKGKEFKAFKQFVEGSKRKPG